MTTMHAEDYRWRMDLLERTLQRKRINAFLVTDLTNIRYLSGFSGSSAFLFITAKKRFFVTDFRYKDQALHEVRGWDIIIERGNRISIIENLCRSTGARRLGFESSAPHEFYLQLARRGLTIVPMTQIIERMRAVKLPSEVACIQKAVARAEEAFLEVKPFIRAGVRECEVASRLAEQLRKKGASNLPFDIIVASGSRSALPHARPTEKKIQRGDLVIIDWGCEAEGYYSDMTRTFIISGRDISRQKKLYQIVLQANKKALSAVVPGISAKLVDRVARTIITQSGYGRQFGHGTGHGVGLNVHEIPRISWNKSITLRENMVFTIEPGIYVSGFGGVRIEDMVVVEKKRARVLTSLGKKLEILF